MASILCMDAISKDRTNVISVIGKDLNGGSKGEDLNGGSKITKCSPKPKISITIISITPPFLKTNAAWD